jgi:hypothetical protein
MLVRLRLTAKRNNRPPLCAFASLRETFFSAESDDLMLVRLRLTAKRYGHPTARCYRNPVPLFAFYFASLRETVS